MTGLVLAEWPDGEAFTEQENLVVTMFDILLDEYNRMHADGKERR